MERCRLIAQRVISAKRANPRATFASISTLQHGGILEAATALTGTNSIARMDSSMVLYRQARSTVELPRRMFATTSDKKRNKGYGNNNDRPKKSRKQQQLASKEDVQNAWNKLNRQLEQFKNDSENSNVSSKDLTRSYNDAVNTWRQSIPNKSWSRAPQQRNVLSEAEAVLAKLDRCIPYLLPTVGTYNMIMHAANKQGSRKADVAQFVETLLERMRKESKSNALVKPTVSTYANVIDSWAKSRLPIAGEKAEGILDIMEDEGLLPNTICFGAVINAYATSRNPGKVEAVLDHMQELYQAGQNDAKPNVRSYTSVIDAWAKSEHTSGPERAESLLYRMQADYQAGNMDAKPDIISFNTVINAWARRGDVAAAARAEAILDHMQKRYKEGTTNVQPDTVTFSTVILAWARIGDPSRAEAILLNMQQLAKSGNADVSPNTVSFNTVIDAYAKSQDPSAPEKAEALLHRMQAEYEAGNTNVRPDIISFNTVIDAWVKREKTDAAQRAEAILFHMEKQYDEGISGIKPNVRTYTAVISAWAKVGDPTQAEAILQRMQKPSDRGAYWVKPNVLTYTSVISSWARSSDPSAGKQADKYLREMRNMNIKPSIYIYTSAIKAWKNSTDSKEKEKRIEALTSEMNKLEK